jgi:hypothetical protein
MLSEPISCIPIVLTVSEKPTHWLPDCLGVWMDYSGSDDRDRIDQYESLLDGLNSS